MFSFTWLKIIRRRRLELRDYQYQYIKHDLKLFMTVNETLDVTTVTLFR